VAISVNWNTLTFSIPQGDLTLITGSLYELDTEVAFRQAINAIMASEEGIVFDDPISHNTSVTVAGTTFARTIEVINGYSITFTPDSQFSVRLAGSNNNIFDVENGILNQNQVQVIAQNSAGLIETGVSGLTAAEAQRLKDLWQERGLDIANPATFTPTSVAAGDVQQTISGDGQTTTTVTRDP
jgi:hypothetical protein